MKKKYLIALFLAALLLAAACVDLDSIVISNPDLSKIADGKYQGSSKVGPVLVTLEVSVKGSVITSIDLIKHRNGKGEKAEAIVQKIIEAQSLNVDVISGATASSKAILQAAENALAGKK